MSSPRSRKGGRSSVTTFKPEIQVLAKTLLLHHLGQVLIRGGQHAGVGGNRREPPTRTITFSSSTRSSLAWQLRLRSPISSRNSVPPEASSNLPGRGLAGVGEGPFLMAKEFAFGQRLGDGGAVHGDERLAAARLR